MATVFDVANYILSEYNSSLTTKRLQKLTFYCQAWYSSIQHKPLFKEEFYAFANGPVCLSLRDKCKNSFIIEDVSFFKNDTSGNILTKDEKKVIDLVLDAYGTFSGDILSDLTHEEEPWKKARGDLINTEDDIIDNKYVISIVSMQNFYKMD